MAKEIGMHRHIQRRGIALLNNLFIVVLVVSGLLILASLGNEVPAAIEETGLGTNKTDKPIG